MTRDTDRDWAKVAEENPYWAVLSDDSFRGIDIPSPERDRFFRSGEQTIEWIFSVIRRHFIADFAPLRSLEYGCGVGRLLIPIARRSGEAIGVDVAPRMLELSTHNLREAAIGNARVVHRDDPIMQGAEHFDFINSFLVLQHIPPERGYQVVADLIRLLRPGGVAVLQLSYARPAAWSANPAATYMRRDGAALARDSRTDMPFGEGTILMFDYDLDQIMVLAAEAAMAPVLAYHTGSHSGHMGVHLFMRKPA